MVKSFGLTSWDDKNVKPNFNKDNEQRLEFVKLQAGNNVLRIITAPAAYWHVKYLDGKSKYGTRVRCSDKALDDATKSECPAIQAGGKAKKRYYVGVIDRKDNQVKVFDMSVVVFESLQGIKEDPEFGMPDQYDINVRFTPDSSTPQGFYNVIAKPPKPLSEGDMELIKSVGPDKLEEALKRLSTPPSVETVRAKLESLGWDGSTPAQTEKKEHKEELEETTEESYSFDKAGE